MSILNIWIPNLEKFNEDYKMSIINKYNGFINTSEIPDNCKNFYDTDIIFPKIQSVYNNIYEAVSQRYSLLFKVSNYLFTGQLSYMFLNKYFRDCIVNNYYLENVLYIDTKLVMEDYKRLMDKEQSLIHSSYTLLENIEKAPLVIWDKVSSINSVYDKNKLIDIISIRKRRNLASFYFIKYDECNPNVLGADLINSILSDVSLGFDCHYYNYDIFKLQEEND